MAYPSALEACRTDLFTPEAELQERYPQPIVDKLLRVREMYTWLLSNPSAPDREFVEVEMSRHKIGRTVAYDDLGLVKSILPMLATASRDFHRWRFNNMILETYETAKKRKDPKTMAKAAADYGKLNRVDVEDEQAMPYDQIVVQPFTATDDPRVLGIKPIPNIQEKINALIKKYKRETIDIEDVGYEEVDLEFDSLFPAPPPELPNYGEEGLL